VFVTKLFKIRSSVTKGKLLASRLLRGE